MLKQNKKRAELNGLCNIFFLVPGLPHHLQWKESNPLKAYWSPPEHKNGPLDGYLVQYGKLTNVSQFETVAYENIFTHNTETELPLKCKSMDDNTVYRLRVSAYNVISGHKVFGPFITEETHLCRYINPDSECCHSFFSLINFVLQKKLRKYSSIKNIV